MKHRIAVLLSTVLAVAAALVMSACSQEQAGLLDEALKKDIKSADVALTMALHTDDGKGIDFSLAGPIQSNGENRMESFDFKIGAQGQGLEQFDGTRLISSGDNIFVEYQGTTYEVGERAVAQLERQAAKKPGGDDIDSLDEAKQAGLDLRSWFPKSDTEDDSKVGDEDTTRVTGVLDLSAALKDLRDMVRTRGAGVDPELRAFGKLRDREIRKLDKAFTDPRFAIDVAKSDGKVRRIAAEARLDGPKASATMRFVLEFREVDEPQEIDAPASGEPIRKLMRRLKRDEGKAQLGAATRPAKVS